MEDRKITVTVTRGVETTEVEKSDRFEYNQSIGLINGWIEYEDEEGWAEDP